MSHLQSQVTSHKHRVYDKIRIVRHCLRVSLNHDKSIDGRPKAEPLHFLADVFKTLDKFAQFWHKPYLYLKAILSRTHLSIVLQVAYPTFPYPYYTKCTHLSKNNREFFLTENTRNTYWLRDERYEKYRKGPAHFMEAVLLDSHERKKRTCYTILCAINWFNNRVL